MRLKETYRIMTTAHTADEMTKNQKIDLEAASELRYEILQSMLGEMHLQPSLSARTPPRTGPKQGPIIGPIFQNPKKLPRSAGDAMSAITPAPVDSLDKFPCRL